MNQEKQEQSEIAVEQPHSVEISVNAKGLFSGKVKVYASTPDEALKECTRLAKDVEDLIKIKNKLQQ